MSGRRETREFIEGAIDGGHFAGSFLGRSGATAPYRTAPTPQRIAVDVSQGLFVALDVEIHGSADESLAEGILGAMKKPPSPSRLGSLAARILAAEETVKARPRAERGGATLVAMELEGGWASFARLGDSAAFRARGGTFSRLTDDDDLARAYRRDGASDDAVAKTLELQSRVILSAFTGAGLHRLEVVHLALRPGDRFLLTTDGVTRLTTHAAMAAVMTAPGLTRAERCEQLLALRGERRQGDAVVLLVELA